MLLERLAIDGGTPVRKNLLPYGRQWLDGEDIAAVVDVLQSDWLTTGPKVDEFERCFAEVAGAKHAVAVSNGTAALHAAVHAAEIKQGDEVIISPMTFASTANCVVFQSAIPVFADVDPGTLLLDPTEVEKKITSRTKAIIAVDYAGQPCDYDTLRTIASRHSLTLIADACHAVGGRWRGAPVGSLGDLSTFSFHPVKHIATGEGGMITTDDKALATRMRVFRNHGITTDHRQRAELGSWFYEMVNLGFNYRLSDIQCALGISQLQKIGNRVNRRREIASRYDEAFCRLPSVHPLDVRPEAFHAYHLYVVRFDLDTLKLGRNEIFEALRAEGIGVNVHYIPVHLHPFYRENFATHEGMCPVAESVYEVMITLPLFPSMTEQDIADVIRAVCKVTEAYKR